MSNPEAEKQPILKTLLIRVLRLVVLTICLGWVALTLGLWLFQEKLIFPTNSNPPRTNPERYNIPFEQHRVVTEDGEEIDVWWMPQDGGIPILFCHGNAGNLEDRILIFQYLHKAGFQILAFDYRGYGASSGKPTEKGLYTDGEAMWEFATQKLGIDGSNWILHGRSLGGGVASYLAEQHEAKALVLESSFTSLVDVASDKYPYLPVRSMARHHFPTLERLTRLNIPLLVVHSPLDRTITDHHGKALYAAGVAFKKYVEVDGGHNDTWYRDGDTLITGYVDFVKELETSTSKLKNVRIKEP